MKYLVRERVFGIGEDFWIEDEQGHRVFFVDGKVLRLRQTFELKTVEGRVLATIHKKALTMRDTMVIERDADASTVTVRKKLISPLRHRFTVEFPSGGDWSVRGSVLDKEYVIEDDRGQVVAEISRRWFRVRDTYAVAVDPYRADVPLLLSVAVCVDALIHHSEDGDRKS